jgi:hypothetical protein
VNLHFWRVAFLAVGFIAACFNLACAVFTTRREITFGRVLIIGISIGAIAFTVRQLLNH